MKKTNFKGKLMAGILAALAFSVGTIPAAMAYMTDIAETMDNPFTIALDSTSEIVEKYPDPDPDPDGNITSYEKSVQVINTG